MAAAIAAMSRPNAAAASASALQLAIHTSKGRHVAGDSSFGAVAGTNGAAAACSRGI